MTTLILVALAFFGGLGAARTSKLEGLSESIYQKSKDVKDKILPPSN